MQDDNKEEYVEELYKVKRPKGTHMANSSTDPDAKRGMLFDEKNELVAHAELHKADEAELREKYREVKVQTEYVPVAVRTEMNPVAQAVVEAAAEAIMEEAGKFWDQYGDEVRAYIAVKALEGMESVKARRAEKKERRAEKKAEKKAAKVRKKQGDIPAPIIEEQKQQSLQASGLDAKHSDKNREHISGREAQLRRARIMAMAMMLSMEVDALSNAVVDNGGNADLIRLSKNELLSDISKALNEGDFSFDDATWADILAMYQSTQNGRRENEQLYLDEASRGHAPHSGQLPDDDEGSAITA